MYFQIYIKTGNFSEQPHKTLKKIISNMKGEGAPYIINNWNINKTYAERYFDNSYWYVECTGDNYTDYQIKDSFERNYNYLSSNGYLDYNQASIELKY